MEEAQSALFELQKDEGCKVSGRGSTNGGLARKSSLIFYIASDW
jgi:hypothetical protein